jgi:hypothetical protein
MTTRGGRRARADASCFLVALVLCGDIYSGSADNALFVTMDSGAPPKDPLSVCGALLNSMMTYSATTFTTSSNSTEADVSMDLSQFCHVDGSASPFSGRLYTCQLLYLFAPNAFPPGVDWEPYKNFTRDQGSIVACAVANEPTIPSDSDISVLLKAFNPKWYACTSGGATVSPRSGELLLIDFNTGWGSYPVPVVIAHSGSVSVTRGSIKTCKLVPKPALLIAVLVSVLSVFAIFVCLTCFFWARCPIYKYRHPPAKKLDDTSLDK